MHRARIAGGASLCVLKGTPLPEGVSLSPSRARYFCSQMALFAQWRNGFPTNAVRWHRIELELNQFLSALQATLAAKLPQWQALGSQQV